MTEAATAATKRPPPEPHWCPGCWVEMPPGSTGKCQPCLDWLSRGPSDDEYAPRRDRVGYEPDGAARDAEWQYHGDHYQA
mgnify:CR=1 FL=1